MPERDGKTPIPPDQMLSRDDAATREEPSVEKLKAELFRREVPKEYQKFFGSPMIELPDVYSRQLRDAIFDYAAAANFFPPYSTSDRFDAIPSAEIPDGVLSDSGRFFKSKVKDGTVIDLGCGESSFMEKYAIAMRARRYIGVDSEMRHESAHKVGDTEVYHVEGSMLHFVARLADNEDAEAATVYYLSGIEPNSRKLGIVREYIFFLLKEIGRTMRSGDVVILGVGTHGFDPTKIGLKQIVFDGLAKKYGYRVEGLTTRVYIKE